MMTAFLLVPPMTVVVRENISNFHPYGSCQYFRHTICIRKDDPYQRALFITFGSTVLYSWLVYAVSWLYFMPDGLGGSIAQFDYDIRHFFSLTTTSCLCVLASSFQTRKPTENLYPPQWTDLLKLCNNWDVIVPHEQILEHVENTYISYNLTGYDQHLRKCVKEEDWHILDKVYERSGLESTEQQDETSHSCFYISCCWLVGLVSIGVLHLLANF